MASRTNTSPHQKRFQLACTTNLPSSAGSSCFTKEETFDYFPRGVRFRQSSRTTSQRSSVHDFELVRITARYMSDSFFVVSFSFIRLVVHEHHGRSGKLVFDVAHDSSHKLLLRCSRPKTHSVYLLDDRSHLKKRPWKGGMQTQNVSLPCNVVAYYAEHVNSWCEPQVGNA